MSGYLTTDSTFAVNVYDTNGTADGALRTYEQALAEGNSVIVGPLTKEGAQRVSVVLEEAPTVLLNYVETSRPHLYQMGLAPEDEARAAARAARSQGAGNAIMLTPDTTWGQRVGASFAGEFESTGGRVLDSGVFDENTYDFSAVIKPLFGLAESEARHRALDNAIGASTRFEPRRRDDVDVVFIAADAQTARMLAPQLRFHHVTRIPIYATAAVNDAAGYASNRIGLRFCGAPIVLEEKGANADLRRRLDDAFHPRDLDALRLLALGYDAYQLARLQLEGTTPASMALAGATGALSADQAGVFRRGLSCAQITHDRLVPLASVATPEPE